MSDSTSKILDVQNVSVTFDGFTVLDQLNFSMGYGELRFLIGPNGAGKTTLLDIITGKTQPTKGRVIFDTTIDVSQHSEYEIVQKGIGRKFQTPSIFSTLTVYENIETACSFQQKGFQLLRGLTPLQREKIILALETIGLTDLADTRAGLLSHGQKQWLEIGMLLIQDPELLMLDEPVAGMSVAERQQTADLLRRITKDRSVIVIEHDMQFVAKIADRVTVLHQGKILAEGSIDKVKADPNVIEVYLGH